LTKKLKRINEPFVLLCEGQHDSQFFEWLLRSDTSLPTFTISSVSYMLGGVSQGGNSRFTEVLDELVGIPGFEHVQKVLIVSDNDLVPQDSFDSIVAQINATAEIIGPPARRYTAPAEPKKKAGNNPSLCVYMLPDTGVVGNFDAMCWSAAEAKRPDIAKCVDAFAACTKADLWPITKASKMKLRSLLSSSNKDNPYISPAYVWSQGTDYVPLDHPIFSDIIAFLRGFPAM